MSQPVRPLRLELVVDPSPELKDRVLRELQAYNRAANPEFYTARELPENAPRPLNLLAFDPAGEVIGGIFAETQLLWLKISIVAVHRDHRRRGFGLALMQAAEEEAIRRGCRHAFLDTMDYQAPGFYEKLGYVPSGRLDNWDSFGHAKLYYTKGFWLARRSGDRAGK